MDARVSERGSNRVKEYVIDHYDPWYPPAYVANGLVGVRAGSNPLLDKSVLEAGFTGVHEIHRVEAYAPLPALRLDLSINRLAMSSMPAGYEFVEQRYDFRTAELATKFRLSTPEGVAVCGEHLLFCPRSMPTLVVERLTLKPEVDMWLGVRAALDVRDLPLSQKLGLRPYADCDLVMQVESHGQKSTAGIAVRLTCADECFKPANDFLWGYESEVLTHSLAGQVRAGCEYVFEAFTAYVPSAMHIEPHWQAVRSIKLATWNGFEAIRLANREAWADIWKGRIVIKGAGERWQEVVDASLFYLFSTMHSSSPYGIAPFGLSDRHGYKGHVFWDSDSFMFMVPLLSDPHIAQAMLDYRYDRLEAARNNARLNGYRGVQYPWQSLTSGDEVTRVSAGQAGGAGEQHVNMDVAMAFVAYAYVSADVAFIREKAWPVVRGVAEWIESRVKKTARGYEILHVCGIDEGTDNVDNDAFTNIMCTRVLREANHIAQRLGYPQNERWNRIADGLIIPINAQYNSVEQYEGIKVKPSMSNETLMAFFPYGYRHSLKVDADTYRFYIEHGMEDYLHYPMLSGFLGVFPAWLGDKAQSLEFFSKSNLDFFCDPYSQCSESGMDVERRARPYGIRTLFLTGRGSLLAGLMMGLTRLNIWHDSLEDWFEGPIVLPEGWEEIEIGRLWIHGRPARVSARDGEQRARIEWLDED